MQAKILLPVSCKRLKRQPDPAASFAGTRPKTKNPFAKQQRDSIYNLK